MRDPDLGDAGCNALNPFFASLSHVSSNTRLQLLVLHKQLSIALWQFPSSHREVDPRIHPVPKAVLPGQRHYINGTNGSLVVDTRLAYSLDYWTLNPDQSRKNMAHLQLLEGFLKYIRISPFQGTNPEY
jgi:hypothetical protein